MQFASALAHPSHKGKWASSGFWQVYKVAETDIPDLVRSLLMDSFTEI